MSKTLAESAAEILNTSLGAPKDAPKKIDAEIEDATSEDADGNQLDNPGAKASASISQNPPPAAKGDPKSVKAHSYVQPGTEVVMEDESDEESEVSLTEEEIEEYLDSLSEEELAELVAEAEQIDEETDEDSDEEESAPQLTQEQIAEARANAIKDLVQNNMASCQEDVDALFNGESLSEEFRTKATTIFEAAVRSRVEAIAAQVVAENEKILEDSIESIQEDLTEQVDGYLNHVVEAWMEENQLAIETGLKVEITEDFINGLKTLFAEHYIEVPEDKADVVEEMAAAVLAAEEKLSEQAEVLAATTKALNEAKATEILRKICEGLTEVQVSKIKSLAEGVEFTSDGEYTEKLNTIRENYFPSGKIKNAAPEVVVETTDEASANAPKDPVMDFYVNAITKQLPKI